MGVLASYFEGVFPELTLQKEFVAKVIEEEEKAFLRTLDAGLKRLEVLTNSGEKISGVAAFELFDTYGFPFDLTRLICSCLLYTSRCV